MTALHCRLSLAQLQGLWGLTVSPLAAGSTCSVFTALLAGWHQLMGSAAWWNCEACACSVGLVVVFGRHACTLSSTAAMCANSCAAEVPQAAVLQKSPSTAFRSLVGPDSDLEDTHAEGL